MIAANLVVYNEQERIWDCLDKVSQWANEIVIVDQSSTDNTVRIIDQWKLINIYKFLDLITVNDKHRGYCEPSRQLAYDHTNAEWIGVIDADEQFTDDFIVDIQNIMKSYQGARLKRSFYLNDNHRFTGDHQLRFFKKGAVEFLDELHTDPQSIVGEDYIFTTPYIGIMHCKNWVEQIEDELRYKELIENSSFSNKEAKLALNVHLPLLEKTGLTAEEVDHLSHINRVKLGLDIDG